jgi:hypothetical protein
MKRKELRMWRPISIRKRNKFPNKYRFALVVMIINLFFLGCFFYSLYKKLIKIIDTSKNNKKKQIVISYKEKLHYLSRKKEVTAAPSIHQTQYT